MLEYVYLEDNLLREIYMFVLYLFIEINLRLLLKNLVYCVVVSILVLGGILEKVCISFVRGSL